MMLSSHFILVFFFLDKYSLELKSQEFLSVLCWQYNPGQISNLYKALALL